MAARLLILGCSATKTSSPFRIPTYERYNGPIWQTFRAVRDAGEISGDLHVLVLSAEHGLLPLHCCIHDYDRRMTHERAADLRSGAASTGHLGFDALTRNVPYYLERYILTWPLAGAMIVAGAVYLEALDVDAFDRAGVSLEIAAGGIGTKRAELRAWMSRSTREPVVSA